jgi:hypothetical protein
MRVCGPTGASLALGALLAGTAMGCAAAPDYGEYLMRWQGKNLASLRADWGEPDYRYRDHRGRETVQYVYREEVFTSLSSGREVVWWCLTNFHLSGDGRVVETSSSGNHCFPPEDLATERERRNRRRGAVPYVPPADATE